MKQLFTLLLVLAMTNCLISQENLVDLIPHKPFDNILIKRLDGDNQSTQFVIWVKDTVRTHRHEEHSETLYVLSGKGTFYLGEQTFEIGPGDFITIPKKSWHAVKVTSDKPMKVLSVQAPAFYGEDRTFKH